MWCDIDLKRLKSKQPTLLVDPSAEQMQVYLSESILDYDGSLLQDVLPEDHISHGTALSAHEQAYGLGCSAGGAEVSPGKDVPAASTSDEYGHQPDGAVGSTPVRAQGPEVLAGVDGSYGTPLIHESGFSNTTPLADALQLSGEAFLLSIVLEFACIEITSQAQPLKRDSRGCSTTCCRAH